MFSGWLFRFLDSEVLILVFVVLILMICYYLCVSNPWYKKNKIDINYVDAITFDFGICLLDIQIEFWTCFLCSLRSIYSKVLIWWSIVNSFGFNFKISIHWFWENIPWFNVTVQFSFGDKFFWFQSFFIDSEKILYDLLLQPTGEEIIFIYWFWILLVLCCLILGLIICSVCLIFLCSSFYCCQRDRDGLDYWYALSDCRYKEF